MARRFGMVLLAGCLSAACIAAATASQRPRENESVDRTTPILNRMTPAQREHAELHRARGLGRSRGRLLDEKITVDVSRDFMPGRPTKTARDVLADRTCGVDAVLLGNVWSVDVLPISDGTALFSDYHVP